MKILQQIEERWIDAALTVIVSLTGRFSSEQFYAAAFWLCYVDYTVFGTPCFAMNTESYMAATNGDAPENRTRWAPANWQFDVINEALEIMAPYYGELTQVLAGKPDADWNLAIEDHFRILARVCRTVTRLARHRTVPFTQTHLPSNFVVGIFEEREGEPVFSNLVRSSIEPESLSDLPSPTWRET